MHLGPLRMQLRAAISFFLRDLWEGPENGAAFFSIAPSINNKMQTFFGAATGSEVFCWGRCTKISTRGTHPTPLKTEILPYGESRLSTQ